jgi:hypothetical protein
LTWFKQFKGCWVHCIFLYTIFSHKKQRRHPIKFKADQHIKCLITGMFTLLPSWLRPFIGIQLTCKLLNHYLFLVDGVILACEITIPTGLSNLKDSIVLEWVLDPLIPLDPIILNSCTFIHRWWLPNWLLSFNIFITSVTCKC